MPTITPKTDAVNVSTSLSVGVTGNGDSTNTADRGIAQVGKPGALVITSTIGATPTVTVNIQGSVDGTNWYNVAYALVATPTTAAVAALVITTAVTTPYLLLADQAWRYLKTVRSSNTNLTLSETAYL